MKLLDAFYVNNSYVTINRLPNGTTRVNLLDIATNKHTELTLPSSDYALSSPGNLEMLVMGLRIGVELQQGVK